MQILNSPIMEMKVKVFFLFWMFRLFLSVLCICLTFTHFHQPFFMHVILRTTQFETQKINSSEKSLRILQENPEAVYTALLQTLAG